MAARREQAEIPETVRSFEPPHCPNDACSFFHPARRAEWRVHRDGFERIRRAPGWVVRFRCQSCGRCFRNSTFRLDYWKKIAGLHARVFDLLTNGQCIRQAARTLRVAPNTVILRQRQLAGQALILLLEMQRALRKRLQAKDARCVLDGLRDAAGSHYEPCDVQITALAKTQVVFDADLIGLRRSGSMTDEQRRIRAERERRLGLPERGRRVRQTKKTLELFVGMLAEGVNGLCDTDKEPDYVRGHGQLDERDRARVRHRRTSSRARRDASNPLWRINHLDRLLRHSLANLKRETIAQAKTAAGLFDRVLLGVAWINHVKGISERRRRDARTTPAMLIGLDHRPRRARSLFRRRRFPDHEPSLSAELRTIYEGRFRVRPREITRPQPKSYAL